MSFIPGDEHQQDEPFFQDDALEVVCELCGEPCTLHGDNNYCDACQAEVDLPVLEPITARPVELNAQLWSEWKRIAEKL